MTARRNHTVDKGSNSLRSRLLLGLLLAWLMFVHLVYYWNFVQTYGGAILTYVRRWLPW